MNHIELNLPLFDVPLSRSNYAAFSACAPVTPNQSDKFPEVQISP
jgi:hypothetical protein